MSGSWFHLRTGRKHVLDAQGHGPKMRTGTRTQSQRGHRRESQQVFSLLGLVKLVVEWVMVLQYEQQVVWL